MKKLIYGFLLGVLACTPLIYSQYKQLLAGDYCEAFHRTTTLEVHVLPQVNWRLMNRPGVLIMCARVGE